MQFIKKHYEKVVLSLVLLVLAVGAAALPLKVSSERERLADILRNATIKAKAKPFKPLDDWLSTNKTALARLEGPLNLELSGPHNLFNPVLWKKMPDQRVVRIRTGAEMGPGALQIKDIKELALIVSFDGVMPGSGASDPPKYQITIHKDTDANPRGDQRTVTLATPRLNNLELLNVQGATNEPTGLVIKLKDVYEPITVTRDKPYRAVFGYAADLVYPPAKQEFKNKRKDDEIKLEDDPERYKIVAITRNEVVLSANSNKRRTIIRSNASNTTAANNVSH